MRTLLLTLLIGCGRLSFDSHSNDGSVADAGKDAVADVIPDGNARAVPAAGCVLHYEMEETSWASGVNDTCGSHLGTAEDGAVAAVDAVRGHVGTFVGGTSCVTTPDAFDLHMKSGLTISAWIKPTMVPPGNPDSFGVVSKRTSIGVADEYSVWLDTNSMIEVDIDGENDRSADPNATYLNTWRQITVVYDGTLPAAMRTKWYVDGALSNTHTETSAVITPGVPEAGLAVGCLPLNGPAQSMVGSMDEVVVWNRALTDGEIATWYTATKI